MRMSFPLQFSVLARERALGRRDQAPSPAPHWLGRTAGWLTQEVDTSTFVGSGSRANVTTNVGRPNETVMRSLLLPGRRIGSELRSHDRLMARWDARGAGDGRQSGYLT